MYNKTCFRISRSWAQTIKIKKVVRRMLGKSVKITFPQQIFNGAFIKRSFIRNAPYDATNEFYEEASNLIVSAAIREAEEMSEGDIITVHVANLEDKLPPEVYPGLCLSIAFKLPGTGLEDYDDCNACFVFRKVGS